MFERVSPGGRVAIGASTWNAVMASAEANAMSGRGGAGDGRLSGGRMEYGKLDAAVTKGVQTGKTASVWHGPAWGSSDAATGDVLPVDYAWHDLDAGTYVVIAHHRGKWYVTPTECPG